MLDVVRIECHRRLIYQATQGHACEAPINMTGEASSRFTPSWQCPGQRTCSLALLTAPRTQFFSRIRIRPSFQTRVDKADPSTVLSTLRVVLGVNPLSLLPSLARVYYAYLLLICPWTSFRSSSHIRYRHGSCSGAVENNSAYLGSSEWLSHHFYEPNWTAGWHHVSVKDLSHLIHRVVV